MQKKINRQTVPYLQLNVAQRSRDDRILPIFFLAVLDIKLKISKDNFLMFFNTG